ncbi:protein kinase [Myxococcota bacterium]|nr:protein kinase [Myxococcota bacterium]
MPRALSPGETVERYRVELPLGQGGMAVVYRVRHLTLGTVHALKVLQVDDPVVRERLVSEGRLQARIRHPHVVAVTDVLEVEGAPALLMDFVGGGSLADRLAEGPLPLPEALALFRGVVQGVAHAHGHGLVHRDLKPANVLLEPGDGRGPPVPRVTDFGLARLTDETLHRQHHTRQGQAMGTPAYMAPEQIRDASQADRRADIWSLGVMLYELCCGQRPFEAPDVLSLMFRVVQGSYPPPRSLRPDLPAPVAAAIAGAMAADRDARIPDCDTLLAVLDGLRTWQVASPGARAPAPPALAPGPAGPTTTWDPTATAAPPADTGTRTFDFDAPALPAPAPASPASAPAPASPAPPPAPAPPAPGPVPSPTAVPLPPARGDGPACSVRALVVDETGAGHVVELVVVLVPGGSGVWAPDGVERDARVAAQLAIAVALGPEASAWGARWGVRGSSDVLHGTSIGLAVALATRAAWLGRELPPGWAFTGGVDLDGRVASVGGLPAKARAARAAGLEQVAAPASDVERATAPEGLRLHGVARFDQAAALLLPAAPPRRRHLRRLPALLLPPALALLGALALPEAWLHHHLQAAIRGPLAMDNTVILAVDAPEPRTLRPLHPETLRALSAAGARAVLVDLAFSSEEPGVDEQIAKAIAEVEAAGTPVVLGLRFASEGPALPGSAALAGHGRLGTVEAVAWGPLRTVVGVRVRRRDAQGQPWWHTATLAAAAALRADAPTLDGDRLRVGPLSAPLTGELLALPPFAEVVPTLPYGQVDAYAKVRGKVVVLGAMGGPLDRDVHHLPDGPRYGVELQAAAVEAILQGRAPRQAPPEVSALAALLAALGALVLGATLPRRLRALALLAPAALLGVGLALVAAGVLVGLLGVLLGAAAGSWVLAGWPARAEVTSAPSRP